MAKQLEDLKFKQVHQMSEVRVEEVCALCECPGHLVTVCPAFPIVKDAYHSNQAEVNALNQLNAAGTHYVSDSSSPSNLNPSLEEAKVITLRSGKVVDKDLPPMQKSVPPPVLVAIQAVVPDLRSVLEVEKEAESPEVVVLAHAAPMTLTPLFAPYPNRLAKILTKYKDPGCPTIPIVIVGQKFDKALLDLGVSVNLLPYSVYLKLGLGDLKATPVTLQLADRSVGIPKGVVEDILIQVGEFLFLVNFIVLDTCPIPEVFEKNPIIFDHPFLATSSVEDDEEPPKPELKPLPDTLKYAFLNGDDIFPVVIFSSLKADQEGKLIALLRKHVGAIGWTTADLQGISPMVCTHRIFLDEDVKPSRQPHHHLNPNMKVVVRAEVLKLLDAGIIYPIAHSEWVSLVQVVPKNARVTVMRNGEDELVPTHVQTGWRVCVDYQKLNASTRKDHFSVPFIDQILERIEVARKDQEKTTFTCPYGTFAYHRMSFGLCNAPETFSRYMMRIFSDMVEKIVEVFMDDFSIFGDSFDECLENLGKVLQRCEEKQLVLNWEKYHFMVTQGIVLGHIVSSKGIEVDKAKVDLITNLPTPKSVKDIRSFLGHTGFYRRFI
ncbi:uncharacterized protein LOC131323682 [Rhododendron vialii]|uniref:uncharacterized protein LOC131323682 n=1 Tax=Rhododendron vialii TaxID=182163 RepID=UPI00265EF696|nr:uncharacterized protein LOC131323682 [Rhododendron vialii]